jgi:hypothetical protein
MLNQLIIRIESTKLVRRLGEIIAHLEVYRYATILSVTTDVRALHVETSYNSFLLAKTAETRESKPSHLCLIPKSGLASFLVLNASILDKTIARNIAIPEGFWRGCKGDI